MRGFRSLLNVLIACVCFWMVACAGRSPGTDVFNYWMHGNANDDACDFPPELWCSSVSIAKRCQVAKQCSKNIWLRGGQSASKVALVLYYESLCPDCQDFFQEQLVHAYPSLSSIMTLELIPYGNARETQQGSTWLFDCQHGPPECIGNLIETCALSLYKDMNVSFPFIYCVESAEAHPEQSAPQCAKAHGIDMSAVNKCVKGPDGNALEHQMALKTDALNPPHEYVPWITLNGEHTDDIQTRAQTDLIKLICDTYQGSDKPSPCTEKTVKPVGKCMKKMRPL